MTVVRLHTVTPAERVSSHEDRVACAPYERTLTARVCVENQRTAMREGFHGPHRPCRFCVDGVWVAVRLSEDVEAAAHMGAAR